MLCEDCHAAGPELTHWRKTEEYDRAVGYLRPKAQMHRAKQAEVNARTRWSIDGSVYGRPAKLPPVGNN